MNKKYVVAVIGCGAISEIYFENMKTRFSILDCKYCCDLNQSAAERFAEKYNMNVITLEEIKANMSIDIVVNLTPPGAHFDIIQQLIKAGKHVYTEKVLAATLEEAKELVALAELHQRVLCAAPDTFLGAGIQTCKYIVDHGLIGTPTSCVAVLQRDSRLLAEKYPYTAQIGGGIGIDVGIYYVTALIHLFGNVKGVSGVTRTWEPVRSHYFMSKNKFGKDYEVTAETLLAGTIEFDNGVVGSLHFNSDSIRNEQPLFVVYGTEGILYMPDPNCFGGEIKLLKKGQEIPVSFPHTHGYGENARGIGVAEMAWSMEHNRMPRTNAKMALHALETLCGIVESGKTNKKYFLNTSFNPLNGLQEGYFGKRYADSEEEAGLTT